MNISRFIEMQTKRNKIHFNGIPYIFLLFGLLCYAMVGSAEMLQNRLLLDFEFNFFFHGLPKFKRNVRCLK